MNNKLTEYVLKHSKTRDSQLKYDFMPSLLEIIERPAHKAGTVIIISIFTLFAAAIVWACFSKIDVVITATGSLQPEGNVGQIRSNATGIVKTVNAKEGMFVKKGELLYELDTEALDIDIDELKQKQKLCEDRIEVYDTLLTEDEDAVIDTAKYGDELITEINSLTIIRDNIDSSIKNLNNDKKAAELNKQIAQLQADAYRQEERESLAQAQELAIQQYDIELEKIDLQIGTLETQFDEEIRQKLLETTAQLNDINSQLNKYEFSKRIQKITAPYNGYISTAQTLNSGDPVTAAQELATVIPADEELQMFCYVKNMDIADVHEGTETEIKLEAYPYNKFGTVKGKVVYISPTSFTSEQMGSVYLVKIAITDDNNIDIRPGLSGAVEIKTGKRTVMDYFLSPIMKGFGDSLKEE